MIPKNGRTVQTSHLRCCNLYSEILPRFYSSTEVQVLRKGLLELVRLLGVFGEPSIGSGKRFDITLTAEYKIQTGRHQGTWIHTEIRRIGYEAWQ